MIIFLLGLGSIYKYIFTIKLQLEPNNFKFGQGDYKEYIMWEWPLLARYAVIQ